MRVDVVLSTQFFRLFCEGLCTAIDTILLVILWGFMYFHRHASRGCCLRVYVTEVFFFISTLSCSRCSLVGSLFTNKNRKGLAYDGTDNFATHHTSRPCSWPSHTHHACPPPPTPPKKQRAWPCFATFKHRFWTKQTINWLKNCCKRYPPPLPRPPASPFFPYR